MKKKILLALLASLALSPVHADEGMWTLYDLPQAVYEQMKDYGYQLPYEKLYQDDDAIMHAVVNFSGYCSGVVVSPDGLVFTNHHCGFESIRSHSTVEKHRLSILYLGFQEFPEIWLHIIFLRTTFKKPCRSIVSN